MTDSLSAQYLIRYSEAGADGKLKLRSLFDYLQELAGNHATQLGVGWTFLHERNLVWVLSRIRLQIDRLPEQGETLTVRTYPTDIQKLFATRQFQVFDAAGELIVKVTSWWLLITEDKHRPQRLDEFKDLIPQNADEPRYFNEPVKLDKCVLPELFSTPVRYTMIDVNRHLNNAEYAGMVQDALELLTPDCPAPRVLQMNFLAAQVLGAELQVGGKINADRSFAVEILGADGKVCFEACGSF